MKRFTLGDLIRECENNGYKWTIKCNSVLFYKNSITVQIISANHKLEIIGDEPESTFEKALTKAKKQFNPALSG